MTNEIKMPLTRQQNVATVNPRSSLKKVNDYMKTLRLCFSFVSVGM